MCLFPTVAAMVVGSQGVFRLSAFYKIYNVLKLFQCVKLSNT